MSNKNKRDYVYCPDCNQKMKLSSRANIPYVVVSDINNKYKYYCKICYQKTIGLALENQYKLEEELYKKYKNVIMYVDNCRREEILIKVRDLLEKEGVNLKDGDNFYYRKKG